MVKTKFIAGAREFESILISLQNRGRKGAAVADELRASAAKNACSRGTRTTVRVFVSAQNVRALFEAIGDAGLGITGERLQQQLNAEYQAARKNWRVRPGPNPAAAGREQRGRFRPGS